MSTNSNLLNAVLPFAADTGVGLIFGAGYFLIKYLLGKKEQDPQKKESKSIWSKMETIEQFNTLIKKKETDEKMNPFEILEIIRKNKVIPDIFTYNNLLNSCYINRKFEIADRLIEEISDISSPVQPDISTYNIILKGISCKLDKEENPEELIQLAEKYFNEINAKGLEHTDITINTMMDIYIKSNQLEKAWNLFDNMEQKYSVKRDKYSYSIIIKSLKEETDKSKMEKVLSVLDFIKNKSVTQNDDLIFNCLLEACFKFKEIEKAEMIFDEMKKIGIVPNKITYGIMIKGYGKVYDIQNAMKMYQEMKNNGTKLNNIIYGCILNTCVRCADITKMNMIYQEMQKDKIEMNIVIYSTLIKGYAKDDKFDKCCEVYQQMLKDENVTPNIIIHNSMLDACVMCKKYEKMEEIYNNIRNKAINEEYSPLPDIITYSTVIKGYCKNNEINKAFDIYEFLKQQKKDIPLDEVIYNSILDGCVKTKEFKKAESIADEMIKNKIEFSNVTYSILVKLYANQNQNEKALKILDEMRIKNIKPGIIVYTCLIQCSFRMDNYNNALKLFENMKNEGIKPDYVLYNTIVNGCLYHHQWESACKYTLESFDKNVKMAYNIYKSVLDKICYYKCNMDNNDKIKYVSSIVKCLKEKHIQIDDETYKRVSQLIYKNNYNKNFHNKNKSNYKK